MFTVIRRCIHKLNSDSLTQYYSSRLDRVTSVIEKNAIIYIQSLISLYDWDESDENKEEK